MDERHERRPRAAAEAIMLRGDAEEIVQDGYSELLPPRAMF